MAFSGGNVLPGVVRGATERRDFVGVGMYVHDSGGGLVRTHHRVAKIHVPVSGVGNRVFRNFAQVLRLRIRQILQGLRRSLFVQSVVVNRLPHYGQVALERCFPGTLHRFYISARSDADQNRDDGDNDHQLKQCETASRRNASLGRNWLLCASNLPGANSPLRAGSLLGATSLHSASHRWLWPVTSSTHQIHFSLPSFVNQDHPTRRAIGSAAEYKIIRIVQAMINTSKLMPCCEWVCP